MTLEIQNAERGLTQSQSLFQLETELVELMSLREEMAEAGESTEAVDNQLAEYVKREVRKVDNIRGYLRHCDVMLAAATDEAKRLCDVAAMWRTRRDRLKECCRITMEAVGAKRIEGQTGSISLKGNGGLAPLEITNDPLIPEEYCDWVGSIHGELLGRIRALFVLAGWPATLLEMLNEFKRTPNNTRIREALKAGPVAGARLGDRGQHIEVR